MSTRDEAFVWDVGTPLREWAVKYCRRQVWRTAPLYDLDDLVGEARLVFAKCLLKYAGDGRDQFCGKFHRCLANHVTDLANERTRRQRRAREVTESSFGPVNEEGEGILDLCGREDGGFDEADLAMMLADAPDPVLRLVREFGPSVRLRMEEADRPRQTNRRLAAVAGLDASSDVVGMVLRWFAGERVVFA